MKTLSCGPFQSAGQPSFTSNREAGFTSTYPCFRNNSKLHHIREIAELWNLDENNLPVRSQAYIMDMMIDIMIDIIKKGKIERHVNQASRRTHNEQKQIQRKKGLLLC